MGTFRNTTWANVKAGDTVLIARVGKVVEVVVEGCMADGVAIAVLVTYEINGRRYPGQSFRRDETVYVQF